MNYEEFTRRLRETGEIYTHGAGFHADDVMTTALINKICDNEGIARPHVNRVFKVTEDMQKNNIVYDIGLGEFDHHQKDNGSHENGIPYAAFGRIWDVVKEKLVPDEAKRDVFERRFTETIDMCDNSATDNVISATIRNMNPNWNEDKTPDMKFSEAVAYAENVLEERMQHLDKDVDMLGILPKQYNNFEKYIEGAEYEFTEAERSAFIKGLQRKDTSIVAAKEKITELADTSMSTFIVQDTLRVGIIHADRPGIPYTSFKEYANNSKEISVMAYTFPARNQYTLKLLDDNLKVPERWLGAQEFDVQGMTFCHPAGISMSFTTPEAAEQAFTVILQENTKALNEKIQSTQEHNAPNPNIKELIAEAKHQTKPSNEREFIKKHQEPLFKTNNFEKTKADKDDRE